MNKLRPVGTRYTENWRTYQNESNSFESSAVHQIEEREYFRTFEIIAHKSGEEIVKVIAEGIL